MGNNNVTIGQPVADEGMIGEEIIKYGFHTCKGRRMYMEDYVKCQINYEERLVPHLGFFAVFDGHGGHRVAEYLRNHFLDNFMSTTPMNDDKNYLNSENITDGFNQSFLDIDEKVRNLPPMMLTELRRNPFNPFRKVKRERHRGIDMTGSTASAVVLTPKHIVVSHIGDSRVIVVREGKVVYSTIDHHPNVVEERKRIEDAGGSVYDNRVNAVLAVSRAIGDGIFKDESQLPIVKQMVSPEPVIKTLERSEKDDYILVASDGLWAVMSNEDTVNFLSTRFEKQSPSSCVEDLMNECIRKKGSKDNVAIVMVKL